VFRAGEKVTARAVLCDPSYAACIYCTPYSYSTASSIATL
jgi:hypothetical protein